MIFDKKEIMDSRSMKIAEKYNPNWWIYYDVKSS